MKRDRWASSIIFIKFQSTGSDTISLWRSFFEIIFFLHVSWILMILSFKENVCGCRFAVASRSHATQYPFAIKVDIEGPASSSSSDCNNIFQEGWTFVGLFRSSRASLRDIFLSRRANDYRKRIFLTDKIKRHEKMRIYFSRMKLIGFFHKLRLTNKILIPKSLQYKSKNATICQ